MLVAQNSLGPLCPVPLTVRGTGSGQSWTGDSSRSGMRPAIGVRRRDAASGRLGGRGGSRWPPRAGHRRALVERQVQVLVYVYYTANQRTLVAALRPVPEGSRGGVASPTPRAQLAAAAQNTRTRDIVKRLRAFVLQAIGPFST
jgi:hypothetical protein